MFRLLFLFIIAVMTAACAAGVTSGAKSRDNDPQAVVGKTWQWEMTITAEAKISAAVPERYTLLLGDDGRAQVRFDCNRGGGSYTISAGRLSFGPMMATRMACPSDSQDFLFMRDLSRVVSFYIENDRLYLGLEKDGGAMRLKPSI